MPIDLYGHDMTPEQRIADIERQMRENANGLLDGIHCPYCGQQMERGAKLCCPVFAKAANAILRRWAFNDAKAQVDRISEAVDKINKIAYVN